MTSGAPRILVVDDEKDTCANLQDILTDLGYEVTVAYDGESALELVKKQAFDVALLDLKLPGIDGLELYRRIRKISSGTVAMIVTAYAASDTAKEAQRAGAVEVLSKPVDLPRLLPLIEDVAEQPLLMVVDDDWELCESLWDILRERGYRVCIANSTSDAEQKLKRQEHRVVLIDMKLPDRDGAEVYRTVRRMSPSSRAVLITGARDETDALVGKVLNEGAEAVCYKPFDVSELLRTIRGLAG